MHIIVCVKQIIDPEIPAAVFKIDPVAKRAIPPKDMKLVVSDYDKNAVEAALKIKDVHGGKVTIISLGSESAIAAIRECLAMGADEGILLSLSAYDDSNLYSTAYALSRAIIKIGEFDLIFCGRQEGDWDGGQVGSGIAVLLDIPCVTTVGKVEIQNNKVKVERIVDDGREIIELPVPALLTISSEVGKPRYPTVKKVMAASKTQVTTWNAQDIGAVPSMLNPDAAGTRMLGLFIPMREAKCEFIEGETADEAAVKLAWKLRENKVI